ncbi:MAG TPA: ATP-dependent 6-phosphofructokinase [Atopostipes sp.]|nr:ATP-dependent 6-phosphofructokinase [Atopostipes sp.]
MQKIGVLTSGGDAPGMNAAINGIVDEARKHEIQVRGYLEGYDGLIDNNYMKLTPKNVKPHVSSGGTFIGTARSQRFFDESIQKQVVERLQEENVSGLIIIGGDGSFIGALKLSQLGLLTIGIPATIDNDIKDTDLSLGFNTAVRNVVESVDIIMQSAASHRHLYAIEVMGRRTGDIAKKSGKALDADGIIARYEDFDVQKINQIIKESQAMGKRYQLFIIAEGAMSADEFKKIVERETEFSIHPLILGHIQRGGNPVADDRILGMTFGKFAVTELLEGVTGKALAVKNNEIIDYQLKIE